VARGDREENAELLAHRHDNAVLRGNARLARHEP
jgi:hypothetical protein